MQWETVAIWSFFPKLARDTSSGMAHFAAFKERGYSSENLGVLSVVWVLMVLLGMEVVSLDVILYRLACADKIPSQTNVKKAMEFGGMPLVLGIFLSSDSP